MKITGRHIRSVVHGAETHTEPGHRENIRRGDSNEITTYPVTRADGCLTDSTGNGITRGLPEL